MAFVDFEMDASRSEIEAGDDTIPNLVQRCTREIFDVVAFVKETHDETLTIGIPCSRRVNDPWPFPKFGGEMGNAGPNFRFFESGN